MAGCLAAAREPLGERLLFARNDSLVARGPQVCQAGQVGSGPMYDQQMSATGVIRPVGSKVKVVQNVGQFERHRLIVVRAIEFSQSAALRPTLEGTSPDEN